MRGHELGDPCSLRGLRQAEVDAVREKDSDQHHHGIRPRECKIDQRVECPPAKDHRSAAGDIGESSSRVRRQHLYHMVQGPQDCCPRGRYAPIRQSQEKKRVCRITQCKDEYCKQKPPEITSELAPIPERGGSRRVLDPRFSYAT